MRCAIAFRKGPAHRAWRGKPAPMVRHFWGGTDNIVWQAPGAVKLAPGPATIRLIAREQTDGGKLRPNAARRNVDVICLTNDRRAIEAQKKSRYLPLDGWLVQDGDLYLRLTNPTDGLGPCVAVIKPLAAGQHSPYWVHVRDWVATRVPIKIRQLHESCEVPVVTVQIPGDQHLVARVLGDGHDVNVAARRRKTGFAGTQKAGNRSLDVFA